MGEKPGHIVTFYSYKGGTGRTMALSNVAWVLASNGCDVLVIDWDLEAPGLHRYLRPFLIDRELTATPGLIDFVWDAAHASIIPPGGKTAGAFPTLEDYTVVLDWDFGERGSISFIPAGRQDDNYAQRVNTFDWDNFYERLGGGKVLEAERERLRASYDYILIDSRTGVSDTSSICTVHMPDILLVFFTLNRQSINGTAAITGSIRSQRPDIPVFPVPTRIENSQADKRDAALVYARRMFARFLLHVQRRHDGIDAQQQAQYWNEVEIPYRPFFAFEEVPAAFYDEPGRHTSVLAPSERIAYWISGSTISHYKPFDEDRRAQVVSAFAFKEGEDAHAEWLAAPTRPDGGRAATPPERVQPAPSTIPSPAAKLTLWQFATAGFALGVVVLGILWGSTAGGAVADVVGIRVAAASGSMKVSSQAARSIG